MRSRLYTLIFTVFSLFLAAGAFAQAPTVTPETEPNNTAGTANLVSTTAQNTAIVSAMISSGDIDFITFTAPAGSRIWISTDPGGTQNAGATSRDLVIDLLASDGTTVIENDDDDGTGNGGDATIETGLASMIGGRVLVTGGTYYLRVRAFSATGIVDPYRIYLTVTTSAAVPEVEPNNTQGTANTIATGSQQTTIRSGSVSPAADNDWYAVTCVAGNILHINTDADPERDGTGTDLVVELRDPAGVLIVSFDSSITGSLANPAAEGAQFIITVSGTYYVNVRHFSATGTGTYDLMVSVAQPTSNPVPLCTLDGEPNNTPGTAQVLNLSLQNVTMVCGSINPGGDLDFFRINGVAAGSKIWLVTDPGGTQNAGATSRDLVMDLLASDGTTVLENDDDDGTGNGGDGTVETGLASAIGGYTLTAGGTYFISLRAFSATGIVDPYKLFIVVTPPGLGTAEVEPNNTAATANTLLSGSTTTNIRTGAIDVAADQDYYAVSVVAGNILVVDVDADPERDGTGTDLVIEVRDPADVLLASWDSSISGSLANPASESGNFVITTSGTYFIKVRHFSATGTGTYHIMASAGSGGAPTCTLTCPANIVQSNDPNQCGAVVTYPAPTTSGSCGTVTASPASGSFFPVGTTTVTATSTGGGTCSFTIRVNDTQAPTITCPANIVTTNSPANVCGANVTLPAPTVSDNCPGVTFTYTPASGSFFPVGTTTVTGRATDASGNTSSCSFTVRVNDVTPPVITCPANIVVPNAANQCGAVVNFAPSATDNCAVVNLTQSSSNVGAAGSVACNNGIAHTENSYWRAYTLALATPVTISNVIFGIELANAAGTGTTQPVNVRVYTSAGAFPGGVRTLVASQTYNIPDQTNSLFTATFTTPATIPGNSIMVLEVNTPDGRPAGNLFFIGSNALPETAPSYLSAADCGITTPTTTAAIGFPNMHIILNATGLLAVPVVSSPASGSFFPVGTTTVTSTATDAAGNTSSCSFTVRVNDTQAPAITCPSNITATTPVGSCVATVNYTVTSSDNCPGVTQALVSGQASGSAFPLGVTTNVWRATDAAGNTSTCSFTVTVLDGNLPVITQQPAATKTVCETTNTTFSVTATSASALAYQWQLFSGGTWNNISNGGVYSGATTNTLTITGVNVGLNTNSYRVNVIGLCTTVTSAFGTLYVNKLPMITLVASQPPQLLPWDVMSITANTNPSGGTFVWFKDGVVIPGVTGATLSGITVDDVGTYKATYTDPNGCIRTSADLVVSGLPSTNLFVYPNPNTGQFQVRYYTSSPGIPLYLSIYDAKGARVYQSKTISTLPYTSIQVDLGSRPAGTYMVDLRDANNKPLGSRKVLVWPR